MALYRPHFAINKMQLLFYSFLLSYLFCCAQAYLDRHVFESCPANCVCSFSSVTCTGADYDDILYFMQYDYRTMYTIRGTPIHRLTTQFPRTFFTLLELSNCQITTIDENFFANYTFLQFLNLDYNYLTELPKLGNLPILNQLSARGNMISKVPPELFNVQNRKEMLESVDLSHNALRDIEFLKPIEQMVYILDLSHNFYTNISMSNYYELNSLDLSYNLLRKESAIELNKIPNLMNLFLKGNAFSSMNVLNLTDAPVKHLDLSQNHLSSPLDFTNFTSLTELHLDDNELTTLPVFPKTLEKLYLKNNKFKGDLIFPENNITEVYLNENNGTTKCEDALANMKKDTSQDTNVKVINNTERKPGMYEISKISHTLFNHRSENVDLSHNSLTDVGFLGPTNRTLRRLDLSHNFIQRFAISNFSALTFLDLKNNLLRTTHSVELNNISKLETLDLAENGIRHLNGLKITETPIKELSLKHNLLYSDLDFSNFNSLSRLNLDDNNLTTLPVMPTTLKVLLLNNNHLNGSNVVFPKLKLKEVYLAGNRMAELPKNAFINLENVDTIDLRNSSFTTTSFHVTPSAIKNNLRIAVDTFVLPNVPQPRIEQNLNYNNTAEEKKHPSDLQNTVELQKHDNPYSDSICHILNGPKSPFCFD